MKWCNIDIFSFFSGAGFLDLGFEKSRFNIVFVNEFCKDFLDAYKYARKKMGMTEPHYGYYDGSIDDFLDKKKNELLTMLDNSKNHGLAGFIGGPPCPDFSIAGKNKGIDGNHGRLMLSYKDIIIECMPDFFVFENVKGLWTTKKHRASYNNIKTEFKNAGYVLIDRLNNALEYGVPQDRERIILIGIKASLINDDIKQAQNYLIENFDWGQTYIIEDIKSIEWPTTRPYIENSIVPCPEHIIEDLTVQYWFKKNDVLHHENANDYFLPRAIDRFETIKEGDVTKKSFKRLHRWRYSPTVAYGNNEVHLHPYFSRRLSVAEALAIQSLPKNFCVANNLSKSNMFKTVGNGVPYLMAKKIATNLMNFLQTIERN